MELTDYLKQNIDSIKSRRDDLTKTRNKNVINSNIDHIVNNLIMPIKGAYEFLIYENELIIDSTELADYVKCLNDYLSALESNKEIAEAEINNQGYIKESNLTPSQYVKALITQFNNQQN